jgi:hypothetical protein
MSQHNDDAADFLDADLLSPGAREILELARSYSMQSSSWVEENFADSIRPAYVQHSPSFSSEPQQERTDNTGWLRDHFLAWAFLQRIRAPLRRLSNFLVDINTLLDQETDPNEFEFLNSDEKENVPPEQNQN